MDEILYPETAMCPTLSRRSSRNNSRWNRPMLCLERMAERIVPATRTWAVPDSGGEYTDPANWQGGLVPGINDTAFFPGTGNVHPTITVADVAGVGELLAGGYNFDI